MSFHGINVRTQTISTIHRLLSSNYYVPKIRLCKNCTGIDFQLENLFNNRANSHSFIRYILNLIHFCFLYLLEWRSINGHAHKFMLVYEASNGFVLCAQANSPFEIDTVCRPKWDVFFFLFFFYVLRFASRRWIKIDREIKHTIGLIIFPLRWLAIIEIIFTLRRLFIHVFLLPSPLLLLVFLSAQSSQKLMGANVCTRSACWNVRKSIQMKNKHLF